MEKEEALRVVRGLVDSLVLRLKRRNPLRSNELVYVEAPRRHTKTFVDQTGEEMVFK